MSYSESCCKGLPKVTGEELVSVGDKLSWHSMVCYDVPYKHINKLKRVPVLNKRNEVRILNKSVDYYQDTVVYRLRKRLGRKG